MKAKQTVTHLSLLIAITASPVVAREEKTSLADALTLHASFDHGIDADFSRGDPRLYSYSNSEERDAGGALGLTDPAVGLDPANGLSGGALRFDKKVGMRPFFRNTGVLDYNDRNWSGTVSIWLRLDPDKDLEPGYCDPVMIVGDHRDRGFLFMEWSKLERPRLFRYAILPRKELWNPEGVHWEELTPSQRPAVEVANAPFSRDRWTHAVMTFDALNAADRQGTGSLYIDGELQGSIENWDLSLGWSPEKVILVLGSSYVGLMDELAVFDRALSQEEVQQLHALGSGVHRLYK